MKKEFNSSKKKMLFLLLTLIMFIGVSLASIYYIYQVRDTSENSIRTAMVSLGFSSNSNAINLSNMTPVIDQVGIENDPYEFTITNTSGIPVDVIVKLALDEENTINPSAIRYAFYVNDELVVKDNINASTLELYTYKGLGIGDEITCKVVFWVDSLYQESGKVFKARIIADAKTTGALYEPITITFNPNSGSVDPTTKEVGVGNSYGTLPVPTRTGYGFDGWTTNVFDVTQGQNGSIDASGSFVASNKEYLSGYIPVTSGKSYTITSNTSLNTIGIAYYTVNKNFTNIEEQSNKSNVTITPTQDGYIRFWINKDNSTNLTTSVVESLNISLIQKITSTSIVVPSTNNTLNANWIANSYTVTFDKQQGEGGDDTVAATYNEAMPSADAPERTGYTFGGYYSESNGQGTKYYNSDMSSNTNYNIDNHTTLYAYWITSSYTISYNLNGGSVATDNPTSYTVESSNITLINPEKAGYTFTGWTGSNGETPELSVTIETGSSGNKSYVANWTPTAYTISYNLNGGNAGTDAPANGTYDSDVQISNPTKTFTVNINANNQEANIEANSASSSQTFVGWTSTMIDVNAKTGVNSSSYENWNGNLTQNTYFKNLVESGNVTMVANWNTIDIALPSISKTGYTCGYAETSDGEIVYQSSDSYTPSTTENSATIYAKCNINVYTITLDKQNGTGGSDSIAVTYNNAMPEAIAPERTGYTFNGYYSTANAIEMTSTIEYGMRVTLKDSSNGWQMTSTGDKNRHINGKIVISNSSNTPIIEFNDVVLSSNEHIVEQSGNTWTYYVDFDITEEMVSARTYGYDVNHRFFDFENLSSGANINVEYLVLDGIKYYDSSMNSVKNWDKLENSTLYANWTINTYTVTFYKNEYQVYYNTLLATLNSRTYYKANSSNALAAYTYNSANTGVVLVAEDINNIKMYYNANLIESKGNFVIDGITYSYSWGYPPSGDFTSTNGIVSMQYTNKTYENAAKQLVSDSKATTTTQTFTHGVSQQLTSNSYSRTGYEFIGWSTTPTGSVVYTNNQNISISSDTNLYAIWREKTSTVTLDMQSGSNGTSSVTATYGGAMPAATAPSRTGYTFGGYYTNSDGTGTKYYNDDMTSANIWDRTENTTLYAKWTVNTYTITFDKQGGTGGSATAIATWGSAMPIATAPTKDGYNFKGYYSGTNGTGTKYYNEDSSSATTWNIDGDTILYAYWISKSGADKLMDKVNTLTGEGTDGLVAVNTDGGLYDGTGNIREYRYSGSVSEVKNWLIFNNEYWRIIGIFKGDTSQGSDVWNIKIMREKALEHGKVPQTISNGSKTYYLVPTDSSHQYEDVSEGTYPSVQPSYNAANVFWNAPDSENDWANSGTKYYLNNESNTNSWYYNNFKKSGATGVDYNKYIATTTWYLRAVSVDSYMTTINVSILDTYSLERSYGSLYSGNSATTSAKIGLINPSDYGYAAAPSRWSYENEYHLGYLVDLRTNWMLRNSLSYWTISPTNAYNTNYAAYIPSGSDSSIETDVYSYLVGNTSNVWGLPIRPVLSLTSSTPFISGSGAYDNPYRIIPKPSYSYFETGRSLSTRFQSFSSTYYYGTSYSFNSSTGNFSLSGTKTSYAYSNKNIVGKYTCKSSSSTGTCTTLYYIDSIKDRSSSSVYLNCYTYGRTAVI